MSRGIVKQRNLITRVYLITRRERDEIDVGWREGVVSERALDGVEIVGSYGGQRPPPTDILMKLVLFDIGSSHTPNGEEATGRHSSL